MSDTGGPYIVWEDYGVEGWRPKSYATLEEAVLDVHYSSYIVTRIVAFEVKEKQTD